MSTVPYKKKQKKKKNIHAVSVSHTYIWNMPFSYVKTAIGVTVEANNIFVFSL